MRSSRSLYRRVSPTWPTTARISSTTTTVSTHAIPFHSGRRTAARWISLFAIAIASRTRSTSGPVSRSSRDRTVASAISAALPPAGWPPTPSMTRNNPRARSRWMRSSLTSRCRPALVSAAARSAVAVCIEWLIPPCAIGNRSTDTAIPERRTRGERRSEPTTGTRSSLSEIEEDRASESDIRDVGQRRLGSVLPFCAVDLVETLGYVAAVQGRSERAQIDQEEPIARRIPADASVLTRHVGRRGDADVHRIRDATAPDGEAVRGHFVAMMTRLVVVLDVAQKLRRRRR